MKIRNLAPVILSNIRIWGSNYA